MRLLSLVGASMHWLNTYSECVHYHSREDPVIFFDEFNELVRSLNRVVIPAGTNVLSLFMNIMFTVKMAKTDIPILQTKVTELLSRLHFEDPQQLQTEMMNLITSLRSMDQSNNTGLLYKANAASQNAQGRRTQSNRKATNQFGVPNALNGFCWNCKDPKHKYHNCRKAASTCEICGEKGHCTEAHDPYTKSLARSNRMAADSPAALLSKNKTSKVKRASPAHNSTVYYDDDDYSEDDDQLQALQAIYGRQDDVSDDVDEEELPAMITRQLEDDVQSTDEIDMTMIRSYFTTITYGITVGDICVPIAHDMSSVLTVYCANAKVGRYLRKRAYYLRKRAARKARKAQHALERREWFAIVEQFAAEFRTPPESDNNSMSGLSTDPTNRKCYVVDHMRHKYNECYRSRSAINGGVYTSHSESKSEEQKPTGKVTYYRYITHVVDSDSDDEYHSDDELMPALGVDSDSESDDDYDSDVDSMPALGADSDSDSDDDHDSDEDSMPALGANSDLYDNSNSDIDSIPFLAPDSDSDDDSDLDDDASFVEECSIEYYDNDDNFDRWYSWDYDDIQYYYDIPDEFYYDTDSSMDDTEHPLVYYLTYDTTLSAYPTNVSSEDDQDFPTLITSYATQFDSATHNINNGSIWSYVDTGSKANLIMIKHLNHPVFTKVKESSGISVTGIDAKAPPIKVTHIGFHPIIGQVLFGTFASNLIGVNEITKRGLKFEGNSERINIIRESNNAIVYTAIKNRHGLYTCDINIESDTLKAYI